jgi:hypothetical protein
VVPFAYIFCQILRFLILKNFVDKESAFGGTNISANEAMEIAF